MIYKGRAYRAHDPRWSFAPTSGTGAAISGGRFNVKGQEALYLSLAAMTAVAECSQGFANRMLPLILCEYDVDCADIIDLTDPEICRIEKIVLDDMACSWMAYQRKGKIAPSQAISQALRRSGYAGVLVPSYVPGVHEGAVNLVLWRWSEELPHHVVVYDPDGRLPTK